jgi:hypothetical protein
MMNVNKVTATVRYSLDTGHGWKSLELGAEASLDPKERWQPAQAQLYAELASQFKALWAQNGNGHPETRQEGHRIDAQASSEQRDQQNTTTPPPESSTPAQEHWCREHQVEFQRRTGKNGTFYSHKAPDGWCNERKGVTKS